MDNNSAETARLLEQVRAGDEAAWNEILARHRPRLKRALENGRSLRGIVDTAGADSSEGSSCSNCGDVTEAVESKPIREPTVSAQFGHQING